jgi:curved DNA-binding protein CbpA
MPARPMLPHDDLYARLELSMDASAEAIEIAWRALLKRHHPDVAGAAADNVAKRINVAHDWLADPVLRERYDRERHPGRRRAPYAPDGRSTTRPPGSRRPRPSAAPRRAIDPAEAVERHLGRIRRLSDDELDRLSLAESPPIAFVASIARFLSPDRLAAVEGLEQRVGQALPPRGRWDAPTRDAAIGFAHELLLGPFLDEHLSEPFRERVRERLARGWEAAVDQPRYGPNTAIVAGAIERLRALPGGRVAQLAVEAAAVGAGGGYAASNRGRGAASRSGPGGVGSGPGSRDLPWPAGLSPGDDDALRVSSALAQRDAIANLPDPAPALARRSLARAMHGLVLRHAFKPAELERLVGVWREIVPAQATPVRPAAKAR